MIDEEMAPWRSGGRFGANTVSTGKSLDPGKNEQFISHGPMGNEFPKMTSKVAYGELGHLSKQDARFMNSRAFPLGQNLQWIHVRDGVAFAHGFTLQLRVAPVPKYLRRELENVNARRWKMAIEELERHAIVP